MYSLVSTLYKSSQWPSVKRTNTVSSFIHCFDSKLQWARNTCERKQAKRRECPPHAVSQHSIYLRYIRPTVNARQTNRQ